MAGLRTQEKDRYHRNGLSIDLVAAPGFSGWLERMISRVPPQLNDQLLRVIECQEFNPMIVAGGNEPSVGPDKSLDMVRQRILSKALGDERQAVFCPAQGSGHDRKIIRQDNLARLPFINHQGNRQRNRRRAFSAHDMPPGLE